MANVSVEEVLTLPAMNGTTVVAGSKGLGNIVRAVNVMEVPDVEAFVRAGDLLLTTAYPVHQEPERLLSLVNVLHGRNLSALAIKPGRYLEALPSGLTELCDRLGFPLLMVRNDLSFDAVIGEVMAVILADYGDPDSADAIRQNLTNLALSGGGLEGIAQILAKAIRSGVRIVDSEGNTLGESRPGQELEVVARENFDITVAGKVCGAIQLRSPRSLTLAERRLTRQASFAAGLHIAQSQAAIRVNEKLKVLALEELISESTEGALSNALLFGWDLEKMQQIIVASPVSKDAPWSSHTNEIWGRSAHSWARGEKIVTIFDPRELELPLPLAMQEWWTVLGGDHVIVAAGGRVKDGAQLPHSYSTAMKAWGIASRTKRRCASYYDLSLELLLGSVDTQAATLFIEEKIHPLIRYDSENGTDLLDTLYVFLGSSSGKEAASRLCIHYNTLKYRIQLIRDLIPIGWDTPERRSAILLALELHRLRLPEGQGNRC